MQSHIEPSQEDQLSPSGGHSSDENVIDNLPIVAVEVIPVEIEKMVTRPQTHTEEGVVQGNSEELQTFTTESPTGQWGLHINDQDIPNKNYKKGAFLYIFNNMFIKIWWAKNSNLSTLRMNVNLFVGNFSIQLLILAGDSVQNNNQQPEASAQVQPIHNTGGDSINNGASLGESGNTGNNINNPDPGGTSNNPNTDGTPGTGSDSNNIALPPPEAGASTNEESSSLSTLQISMYIYY